MDNLKDLYNAAVEVERVLGITEKPRLSTPILKEQIGNNENIAGKLHVWRRGEWRKALGYISKDELLRLAPEPTPEEWQVGDWLKYDHKDGCVVQFFGGGLFPEQFTGIMVNAGVAVSPKVGAICKTFSRIQFRPYTPTSEEIPRFERIATNAKLKAEWEKEKFPLEWKQAGDSKWIQCRTPQWFDDCEYRRKPDPVYVPWTAEDDLLGVKVRSKSQPSRKSQVIEQNPSFVWIGDAEYRTYADFFAYFEQLDGTPCGKVKEEGK